MGQGDNEELSQKTEAVSRKFESLRATELLQLGAAKRPWRISDAIEGTQIFGATGSGKTTGSGRTIALAFLRARFGGLVLTAKPDERALWEQYLQEAGRPATDLIIVGFDQAHRFNFLDYEFSRPGRGRRLTQNLVSLFCTAFGSDGSARSSSDPYWEHALRQLLTNAIDTVALARTRISLQEILQVILTAPRSVSPSSDELGRSFCVSLLEQCAAKDLTPEEQHTFEQCMDYWSYDFAGLAERTRSVIVSSFTARATSLLRGPLRTIFCSEEERTFGPEDSHKGKVILLDLPVKEFGDAGRLAQVLFKTIWQRATERRDDFRVPRDCESDGHSRFNRDFRPVFLWADESQHFVTSEDAYFQATARSSLAATVYLTQNISNYYAALGGHDPRAVTDSFLGNLVTKIFHANGDPATNEWAERLFGRSLKLSPGLNVGFQRQGESASFQQTEAPIVRGSWFASLKGGGPPQFEAESIIFHPRSIAADPSMPFIKHPFKQSFAFKDNTTS